MKYGLYLYGSEYRKLSLPTSDVDIMVVLPHVAQFQSHRPQVVEELLSQYPEWKHRKLDFRLIEQRSDRSPKAAEVFGLAELWQQPRTPIRGDDLVPLCYKPTWEDYYLAVVGQIVYWTQQLIEPPMNYVMERLSKAGTVKPIYNFQFYLSLIEQLKSQPNAFVFSGSDLTDSDFRNAKSFLRETLFYKFPEDQDHRKELHRLLTEMKKKATKLKA